MPSGRGHSRERDGLGARGERTNGLASMKNDSAAVCGLPQNCRWFLFLSHRFPVPGRCVRPTMRVPLFLRLCCLPGRRPAQPWPANSATTITSSRFSRRIVSPATGRTRARARASSGSTAPRRRPRRGETATWSPPSCRESRRRARWWSASSRRTTKRECRRSNRTRRSSPRKSRCSSVGWRRAPRTNNTGR